MRHSHALRSRMRYSLKPGFTETRLRPLARRRLSTARPLFVFIRSRNPWTLERRRRLGWNVRLGMNPLLLIAQNGRGKTKSITERPSYLDIGRRLTPASNVGVSAVTFT